MSDRQAFAAIVCVLRTGMQWNALPRELGASSTVHNRFQEWEKAGFFNPPGRQDWGPTTRCKASNGNGKLSMGDAASAPFGKSATSLNPTIAATRRAKRSPLTDGAGIPLALVIDGANRHDMKLLCETLDGIVIARPEPTQEQPQHMCLDAGYDYPVIREQVKTHDYLPHIRGRGQEKQEKIATPGLRAHRWLWNVLTVGFIAPVGS